MASAQLADDPTFLQYQRALGFDQAQAGADRDLGVAQAQAQYELAKPELEFAGEIARRDISGSFEDRGLFGSGQRLRTLAEQQRGEQAQLAQLELSQAGSIADLQQAFANTMIGAGRTAGEGFLSSGSNAYLRRGLEPYR